jgi:hypothetical protein
VDGEVDLTRPQGLLELGREETLAADRGQRLSARLRAVALRDDRPRAAFETGPGGLEQAADLLGL